MQSGGLTKSSIDVSSLKISIVICCHSMERIDDIRQAVQSALDQTCPLKEVIVAVDHNTELIEKLKSELPESVKLVANSGAKGLSDTRNAGIQSATGQVIAFIDDDAIASKDCMDKLLQQYQVRSVVAVGGRSVPVWISGRPSWFPEELDWIVGSTYKGAPESVEQVNRLIGCNMSFRREAFKAAGLFSTDLGRTGISGEGEDSEICMRIRQRMPGTLILYEPNAIVYHKVPPERATFRYLISRSYSGGIAVACIGKMYASSDESSLSTVTERSYLQYLLNKALPERFRHIYRLQAITQLSAIMMSIFATGLGYLIARVKKGK